MHKSIPAVPSTPRNVEKCRKHSPAARIFLHFLRVLKCPSCFSQCNTRLRLLYLLNRMNQMRPVAKRDNSCTLKAPDLAILEFEIE